MEWRDQGTILSLRLHGETAAIIEVFTPDHGRHAGVVRGGASRRMVPVLQPGTRVDVEWRARLDEHLGTFRVEPLVARAALIMSDRTALAALNAVCALLIFTLPEREPHPRIHVASEALLDLLAAGGDWQAAYLEWEMLLLEDLGFGLDLKRCAVTGDSDGLEYVSPRSGRAVSRDGAGDWAERLLSFPDPQFPARGLRTTGYFLEHRLAAALGRDHLPEARTRLLALLDKQQKEAGQ
ncbi:MAG: DNA repair protein RecO [Rhodobacteraceae bacterium]|nr:DNA repair protein RecO [Paracoccaceae bacterium]